VTLSITLSTELRVVVDDEVTSRDVVDVKEVVIVVLLAALEMLAVRLVDLEVVVKTSVLV
jgi:hypothetical protein